MYVDMFLNKHPNLEKIVINKLRQISFDPLIKAYTIINLLSKNCNSKDNQSKTNVLMQLKKKYRFNIFCHIWGGFLRKKYEII